MAQSACQRGSQRQAALCVLVAVLTTACGARIQPRPIDATLADRYLLERGREAAAKRRWTEAREYFRQLVENHPGSPLRAEAKLATGDAYLSEASAESLVLAANEYREFLIFYPNDPRADRAQYSIAMTFFKQMRKPERDQTPTKAALREFDVFFQRYPMSPRTGWAKRDWRVARDRLSASWFDVGRTYFKTRYYPGAISRFNEVIAVDPGYTQIDGVFFYLAESLARTGRSAEAIPLFDRVAKQPRRGEYGPKAEKRLRELARARGTGIRPAFGS